MKALVVVASLVALACGALAVQDKDQERGANGKKQEGQGITVMKPSQAEWKQAEKMPQGVMKALVCESKSGGAIFLMKFPAGTKLPAHTSAGEKVIHVHSGSLEISQGAASGQPGRAQQDQPGRGEGLSGQAQMASAGDIIKISPNTTYSLTAKSETLALVAMESKGEASGQRSSDEPENKVK
jgi:quercetin dioxygenase-like cupin family protein